MSEPPPPVPIACQVVPGLALIGPPPVTLAPFISQIETWPLLAFLGKAVMIEIAGSDRVPAWPGIDGQGPTSDQAVVPHFPDRDLAGARVLKKDVGKTVVVEIASSDRLPSRPGIGADRSAAGQGVSVHLPDRDLAG